jgi:hypothetical protein
MKAVKPLFSAVYVVIVFFFLCCAIFLVILSGLELWHGINPTADMALRARFNSILEAIGLLTVAVAALELGQTVLEEEVMREVHVSAPTRVRRFLSRFLIVVVVALSVETLVAVFQLVHENPGLLPQAASVGIAAAALLAAWGVFIKLNRSAEELEPEAMAEAKREDHELE